jgi:riboflavin kinase/FMN adenylyltransferase
MQFKQELAIVKPEKETLLSIGVFDGVHLGHQRLLAHLRDEAKKKGWLSGVVTFKSHPEVVLSHARGLKWLSDVDARATMIRDLGIDIVVPLTFTSELAKITGREFVQLLQQYLKMHGLIVGPDFALGRNRDGDIDRLRLMGREMGFSVEVIPPVVMNGEVISSSAIRQALTQGDIEKVQRFFGRPFTLSGQVVLGDKRGRVLGFPTANMEVKPDQAVPGDGIYVTLARVGGAWLPSVTNIGLRPTFGGKKRLVETYILNFDGDLYGKRLEVKLLGKLRDEKRFDTAEELKTQMRADAKQAGSIIDKQLKNKESEPRYG